MREIVLRRISWQVLFGVISLGIGIGMVVAIWRVTSVNGFRMGWQGIPVYLALVGFIGRIANCKIVLRDEVLVVVNPLQIHVIPKSAIRDIFVDDGGTLGVGIGEEQEISVFAFAGSLIDHFRGTSDKAERRINRWLSSGGVASETEATPQVTWTRCLPADLSLAFCVAITGIGLIGMAITSG
ncbi:hypothetical protein [Streptomyces iconiensis]|uniref:PH domain-containing protein n=1 Tax=Streptomyces iconiensis TaxID=1384038 RepID=A0ABT7A800_9ACTN|nr:hypothetical protein [Streptomyces iconiensis]MDJ1137453.1 hypothetical protein [Streptomyces iconiensis]